MEGLIKAFLKPAETLIIFKVCILSIHECPGTSSKTWLRVMQRKFDRRGLFDGHIP